MIHVESDIQNSQKSLKTFLDRSAIYDTGFALFPGSTVSTVTQQQIKANNERVLESVQQVFRDTFNGVPFVLYDEYMEFKANQAACVRLLSNFCPFEENAEPFSVLRTI
jgi:mannose/cellobiose epimerase-like protein (N-acyl-D-glucosamine 2-epimerase family)